MEIDPETRKHALRSGQSVDTAQDRESRIARYEAVKNKLEERKGASNGGKRNDGSTDGRPTPPEPTYRPVGQAPYGDAQSNSGGEGPSGTDYEYDSRPPRKNRGEPRNIREALGGRSAGGRLTKRVDSGPKSGDTSTSGEEVPGPLDKAWDAIQGAVKEGLNFVGINVSGDADALSESEAEELLPKVALFIQFAGGGADLFFTHINANHEECDIWTFEDEEANDLALMWLKRARRSRWMATASRSVSQIKNVKDAKRVGEIFGKRLGASLVFVPSNGGFKPWLR